MHRRISNGLMAVLASAAVLAAASCGSDDEAAGGGASATEAPEKVKVAFVAALVNDTYFVTVRCGAEAAAKKLNVDLNWSGSTTPDVAKQVSALNAASVTNPDGIVLAPFSDTPFGGTVRKLMSQGVPVALSGGVLNPPDGLVTFITNFREGGNSLADVIGDLTGGRGKVGLIAQSTGNPPDSDRYKGLIPILKERYPELEVLSPEYAQTSTAKAASIASSLIRAHKDMNLIYATNGPQAAGAASAISAAKAGDRIKLISFDSNAEQIKLLQQDRLAATIGQSPFASGELSVTAVVDYVREKGTRKGKVPSSAKIVNTPTKLLTPENVDTEEAQRYQYLDRCES